MLDEDGSFLRAAVQAEVAVASAAAERLQAMLQGASSAEAVAADADAEALDMHQVEESSMLSASVLAGETTDLCNLDESTIAGVGVGTATQLPPPEPPAGGLTKMPSIAGHLGVAAAEAAAAVEVVDELENRVAQAEEVYRRERAKSVVSTWKYVAVEVPALCIQLKGIEATRGEVLATCQWRTLEQMGALPLAHTAAVDERNGRAARRKGKEWLDATL